MRIFHSSGAKNANLGWERKSLLFQGTLGVTAPAKQKRNALAKRKRPALWNGTDQPLEGEGLSEYVDIVCYRNHPSIRRTTTFEPKIWYFLTYPCIRHTLLTCEKFASYAQIQKFIKFMRI